MKVALGGMFRNSSHYLVRYFDQVASLQRELTSRGDTLQLVLAEGDSGDDTWNGLLKKTGPYDTILVKREHGKRWWGSTDDPERWEALSWVCNGILEQIEPTVDAFVYVETDLSWEAKTMTALLKHLEKVPAVAPMCFTAVGDFYDIWGHIKDGIEFSPFPPYHQGLNGGLTEVDSAGSCLAMLGEVARKVKYGPNDLVRGLGRSIRENGYSLWVDPNLRVVHL